jgi:uncharacterized repeat protein (TIGR03803 family)
MENQQRAGNLALEVAQYAFVAARVLATVLALTVVASQAAQAQTYNVLHNFTDGQDGGSPFAGLTMDRGGNLYGTTVYGGTGNGTVFKMAYKHSAFVFSPLYSFAGGRDGANPQARVIIGPDGSLYGTTQYGGQGYGIVFKLTPPPTACKTALCPWKETVLYRFSGGTDGGDPFAEVIFDQVGNLYGTTVLGGGGTCNSTYTCGVVYELTPSNGSWTESVLYSFTGSTDGGASTAGLIFDSAGNLYGTTTVGGLYNGGTVFQLSPAGSGWAENVLYSFMGNDGYQPVGGLTFDQAGNLYGTTKGGGLAGGGVAFELTPSNGIWTQTRLYSFGANDGDGLFPYDRLAIDTNSNLYGTTSAGGPGNIGNIFELTPANGGWTGAVLHNFTDGSDGATPFSGLIFDANGNLYGTADSGGTDGFGVVFEITPQSH